MCGAPLHDRLVSLVAGSNTVMRALTAVNSLNLHSWCIGAGIVRNLVWDHLHGFDVETKPSDIDVVFFEPNNLSVELEELLERKLMLLEPAFKWEVVNQAGVHQWLQTRSTGEMKPFQSLAEGIASWPEIATCVGISLTRSGTIDIVAPHGLTDLFDMVVRRNADYALREVYRERVARKCFTERWPNVKVIAC